MIEWNGRNERGIARVMEVDSGESKSSGRSNSLSEENIGDGGVQE